MEEVRWRFARFASQRWYELLWVGLTVIWLPVLSFILPAMATGLMQSGSMVQAMEGFLIMVLLGLGIAAAAIVILAATTAKILGRPPAEVPVRAVWSLFAAFGFFLCAVIAVPLGAWITLATRWTPLDIPVLAFLILLLAAAALYVAAASELGARQGLQATVLCLRRNFWRTGTGASLLVVLLTLLLFSLSRLGLQTSTYLYLASAAAMGCSALTGRTWDAARRRATPERGPVRPQPRASAMSELRRVLTGLLARGERV